LVPDEAIKAGLDAYEAAFAEGYGALMQAKLGLKELRSGDDALMRDLLDLMRGSCADYTNVFRSLCDFRQAAEEPNERLRDYFVDRNAFEAWATRYKERLRAEGRHDEERAARMRRVNPKYVLRNYLAHTAIQMAAEQKDFSEIERLRRLLCDPFAEQPEMDRYAAPPPDWGKRLIVSCSS
jgi:uncharacterized protein YdiU (UPF0061 family)